MPAELPEFHPDTVLRRWPEANAEFRISDAVTGVACFGATGSGKTSGPARHLALAYLAADFGGIVLCAKKEEREQWQRWAQRTDRLDDLIIIDRSATWRFNFLDWESSQASEGGGLTINVVALLEEVISALTAGKTGGGDDGSFWEDALHQLLTNAVELVQLAGFELSLSLMRDAVRSAPTSRDQARNEEWKRGSACWGLIDKADAVTAKASEDVRTDFEECRAYWLDDFANLSERTRSVIVLMFTKLAQPFTTRPLRALFSSDTNVRPEHTFDGRIIIVDLPTQEFRLAGRIAALVVKYCWQVAVMRRAQAPAGTYLRPVFCWADEAAENFVSRGDPEFQAVARSSGGCTVYLGQNINQYRHRLGSADAFEAFVANLQAKFFCQNTGETNEWAAKLLGQSWQELTGRSASSSEGGGSASVSTHWQLKNLVEPNEFTTLARGGGAYRGIVETIVYKGGHVFSATGANFFRLSLKQEHDPPLR